MSTGSGTSSSVKVLMAGVSWRLFGSRRAGEILLRALASDDEQNRMLAGMSLVKAGDRSLRLIEKKLNDEKGSVPLVRLLPDIGGEDARGLLETIVARNSGEMAEAATECIDLLDRVKAL